MGEVYKFLRYLKKRWVILLTVPLVTLIITFLLVRNLPNTYISQAQLSTGLVDETQQTSITGQSIQGDQVRQQFSNILEMMRMKRVLDQVSYRLIIHDLTSGKPFKEPSELLKTLNFEARKHALQVYREKYELKQELVATDSDQQGMIRVLESMAYDSESLKSKLQVFRSGESDFISIQYESEDPDLSTYVVNTLSKEFIDSYTALLKSNQIKSNDFLRDLLKEKTDTLARRMSMLRDYKIRNGVLNLTEQSKQLYTLLLEYDTKKQEAIERTSSYAGALNEIDRKFDPNERRYIESRVSKINQTIVRTKNELQTIYNLYINNNLSPYYKLKYDSLNNKLTEDISKYNDQYITNPLNAKQELIAQKMNLEIQMDISRYSLTSLENKIALLNAQLNKLVPKEAEVQTLEMQVDIASKEYAEILSKFNSNSLESSFSSKLTMVQMALPGAAQSSKKILLVILSAIVSFLLCVVFFLLVYYFDESILTPQELANVTNAPVLGIINFTDSSSSKLSEIWTKKELSQRHLLFKDQMRSLRHEIERSKAKVLMVTSLDEDTGKSFICMNLAASLIITFKKILIIDGDFMKSYISKNYQSDQFVEDFFADSSTVLNGEIGSSYTILKNRGDDYSLMELASEKTIIEKFEAVKNVFDLIIIDTSSLQTSSHVKEWIAFSDGILGVFRYGDKIDNMGLLHFEYIKKTFLFKGWVLNKILEDDQ